MWCSFFFFNDTATTEIYTLSLHDALPICVTDADLALRQRRGGQRLDQVRELPGALVPDDDPAVDERDRKSTRLNSSHANISYAVFCLKKKIRSGGIAETCDAMKDRGVGH